MDQRIPQPDANANDINIDIDIDSFGVVDNLAHGARLGSALGLDEQHLEAIYTLALGQYQQGRYADAMKLFAFITFHDQTFMKAFKGIGCCLQMLGRCQEALLYLGLAIIDDDTDLQTAVQIAECLIHVGQHDDAKQLLKRVSRELEHGVANDYARQKAQGLFALLTESLTAQPAEDEHAALH